MAAVFCGFNSDVSYSNDKNLDEEEVNENSMTEIVELNKIIGFDMQFLQKESNFVKVPFSSNLSSNLVFIPSSHDFGRVDISYFDNYNFQLKNLGTATSGSVSVYLDSQFSCVNGSTYNLQPSESQYVTIQFAPCTTGETSATVVAGSASATVEGEGRSSGQSC